MYYQIRPDQELGGELKRIIECQIELMRFNSQDTIHLEETIYEIRKACKRMRALLSLVRPILGKKIYDEENKRFRDIAQSFAGLRDAKVFLLTWQHMLAQKQISPLFFEVINKVLIDHHQTQYDALTKSDSSLNTLNHSLLEVQSRLNSWPLFKSTWPKVLEGLKRTYKQGHNYFEIARGEPATGHFHQWRKPIKYVRYQLESLSLLAPDAGSLSQHFQKLGNILGSEHDLVLFQAFLEDGSLLIEHPEIISLISQQRLLYQNQAYQLGQELYHNSPKEFVKNIRRVKINSRAHAKSRNYFYPVTWRGT